MTDMQKTEPLVIPANTSRLWLVAGLCIFLMAAGVMVLLYPSPDFHPAMRFIATWGNFAFFGAALAFALSRILRPRPVLVVDERGIVENGSALGAGCIAWDEIAEVTVAAMFTQRFLSIRLKPASALLERLNPLKAMIMRLNKWLLGCEVNVSANMLPVDPEDLVDEILSRRP